MIDSEALRERWLSERQLYDEFARYVAARLEAAVRRHGIACSVQARAKDVASFLKKALRKRYASPFEEIGDKAGVRLIVTYHDTLAAVEGIVRSEFVVVSYENKTESLHYSQLGYLGIHLDVTLPQQLLVNGLERFRGITCEVQLHTRAQNLWADISHQLSYKPSHPPPPTVQRKVRRLLALVEIFDEEVADARKALLAVPGYEDAVLLDHLERHYYRFTARPFDRELSLEIIGELLPLLAPPEVQGFGWLIDRFVDNNSEKLSEIFQDYANDQRCNPLLFQPESILVFERLEKDPFLLRETWARAMPISLLEGLATIWGLAL